MKGQTVAISCGRRAGKAAQAKRLDAALRELRDCLVDRRRLFCISGEEEALLAAVNRALGEKA